MASVQPQTGNLLDLHASMAALQPSHKENRRKAPQLTLQIIEADVKQIKSCLRQCNTCGHRFKSKEHIVMVYEALQFGNVIASNQNDNNSMNLSLTSVDSSTHLSPKAIKSSSPVNCYHIECLNICPPHISPEHGPQWTKNHIIHYALLDQQTSNKLANRMVNLIQSYWGANSSMRSLRNRSHTTKSNTSLTRNTKVPSKKCELPEDPKISNNGQNKSISGDQTSARNSHSRKQEISVDISQKRSRKVTKLKKNVSKNSLEVKSREVKSREAKSREVKGKEAAKKLKDGNQNEGSKVTVEVATKKGKFNRSKSEKVQVLTRSSKSIQSFEREPSKRSRSKDRSVEQSRSVSQKKRRRGRWVGVQPRGKNQRDKSRSRVQRSREGSVKSSKAQLPNKSLESKKERSGKTPKKTSRSRDVISKSPVASLNKSAKKTDLSSHKMKKRSVGEEPKKRKLKKSSFRDFISKQKRQQYLKYSKQFEQLRIQELKKILSKNSWGQGVVVRDGVGSELFQEENSYMSF